MRETAAVLAPGVLVVSEPRRVELTAAEIVANRVRARRMRLLLPTEGAARGLYAALRGHAADGSLSLEGVTTLQADDDEPIDLAVLRLADVAPPTVSAAREVLVLATGERDAEAVQAMLEGPVSPLRGHPAATVVCDAAAAARLSPVPGRTSNRVVVVLGHREPTISPEHRISSHSRARMFRAEEACLTDPVRAAILTGYTQSGGLSEAEQMQREWTVPGVPVVTEVAGQNTAENASRSLPLILAIGGIREVLVVTSLWHVRAPFFFAPYGRYRLRTRWLPARPLRHWGHLVVEELAKLPAAPVERAAAMREVRLPAG